VEGKVKYFAFYFVVMILLFLLLVSVTKWFIGLKQKPYLRTNAGRVGVCPRPFVGKCAQIAIIIVSII